MIFSDEIIEAIKKIAKDAGDAILDVYNKPDSIKVKEKSDNSPITQADLAAHHIIEKGLSQVTPDIPILSEESAEIPFAERQSWSSFWLVDPLDGTKEFIARTDDFTVNIAFVSNHAPIFGLIYLPIEQTFYYGAKEYGAFKQVLGSEATAISTSDQSGALRVSVSRRHQSDKLKLLLDGLEAYEVIPRGSSIKMCLVAEGSADLYPRLGPTCEWDTGAGQCILEAAGGGIIKADTREPLRYNTKDSLVNPGFFCVGDLQQPWGEFYEGMISRIEAAKAGS